MIFHEILARFPKPLIKFFCLDESFLSPLFHRARFYCMLNFTCIFYYSQGIVKLQFYYAQGIVRDFPQLGEDILMSLTKIENFKFLKEVPQRGIEPGTFCT